MLRDSLAISDFPAARQDGSAGSLGSLMAESPYSRPTFRIRFRILGCRCR